MSRRDSSATDLCSIGGRSLIKEYPFIYNFFPDIPDVVLNDTAEVTPFLFKKCLGTLIALYQETHPGKRKEYLRDLIMLGDMGFSPAYEVVSWLYSIPIFVAEDKHLMKKYHNKYLEQLPDHLKHLYPAPTSKKYKRSLCDYWNSIMRAHNFYVLFEMINITYFMGYFDTNFLTLFESLMINNGAALIMAFNVMGVIFCFLYFFRLVPELLMLGTTLICQRYYIKGHGFLRICGNLFYKDGRFNRMSSDTIWCVTGVIAFIALAGLIPTGVGTAITIVGWVLFLAHTIYYHYRKHGELKQQLNSLNHWLAQINQEIAECSDDKFDNNRLKLEAQRQALRKQACTVHNAIAHNKAMSIINITLVTAIVIASIITLVIPTPYTLAFCGTLVATSLTALIVINIGVLYYQNRQQKKIDEKPKVKHRTNFTAWCRLSAINIKNKVTGSRVEARDDGTACHPAA